MTHVQLDLFGHHDTKPVLAQLWALPATCTHCGTHEPSGHLLRQNHGVDPDGISTTTTQARGLCTAQWLVTNHITYAVKHGTVEQLARDSDRGRQLRLDVDAIIAAARQEMAP